MGLSRVLALATTSFATIACGECGYAGWSSLPPRSPRATHRCGRGPPLAGACAIAPPSASSSSLFKQRTLQSLPRVLKHHPPSMLCCSFRLLLSLSAGVTGSLPRVVTSNTTVTYESGCAVDPIIDPGLVVIGEPLPIVGYHCCSEPVGRYIHVSL